ncbi:MAG TPA: DUF362 domain-containing protein, partial [Chromatiaceae bacterium]|nr:DUF362 domain-containing protein [Chromatiaceae bacterium]
VLVKPNCVSSTRQLASTHVDALEAVLEAVIAHDPKRVIVGEGSAVDTEEAFRSFGYRRLLKRFDVELMDLNRDRHELLEVFARDGGTVPVRVSRTALEAIRVSVALPKTHDTVIVTLSLKNMVMGAILKGDKWRVHQGYPAINLSLTYLGRRLRPHLGVIDGFVGMEGDGPTAGTEVPHRVALAGTDPIALDAVAAYLMGFDPGEVGYLVHAQALGLGVAELGAIEILLRGAEEPRELVRRYRPHRTYAEQRRWEPWGTPLEPAYRRLIAGREG